MSKYSRCEIWTPETDKMICWPPAFTATFSEVCGEGWSGLQVYGTCWTATMRGKANGTVKRDASEVLDHPEHWDYIEVEVTDDDYNEGIDYAETEVKNNKGYSFRDTLKFVGLSVLADKLRNICSEFCNNFCVKIKVLSGWGVISPKKLHKKLTKLGYETKPLYTGPSQQDIDNIIEEAKGKYNGR